MNPSLKPLLATILLAFAGSSLAVVPEDCSDSQQCLREAIVLHFDNTLPQRIHPEVEMLDVAVVGDRASFTAVSYVPSDRFSISEAQLEELKESVSSATEEWVCSEPSGLAPMFIANGGTVIVSVSHIDYEPMARTVVSQCP